MEQLANGKVALHCGDCLEVMASLPENSIDSIVCDPPYHLISIVKRFGKEGSAPPKEALGEKGAFNRSSRGFMNTTWDGGDVAFRPETWAAALRVLKPGGHLVAFSGCRTYHRMAVAIEDAGFQVREMLAWTFGSGFPKSHDVSKGIDKHLFREWLDADPARRAAFDKEIKKAKNLDHAKTIEDKWKAIGGYLRGVIAVRNMPDIRNRNGQGGQTVSSALTIERGTMEHETTQAATALAAEWEGWGSALKPAWEPICLARKPLVGTIVENVLMHRTGGIHIDACRIEGDKTPAPVGQYGGSSSGIRDGSADDLGRFPANLLHDGSAEVLAAFPETNSGAQFLQSGTRAMRDNPVYGKPNTTRNAPDNYGDGGGSAARFFYAAKHDTICELCGLNYDGGWSCDAVTAEANSQTESTQIVNFVLPDAAGSPLRAREDKKNRSRVRVSSAVKSSNVCHQQNVGSALPNVPQLELLKIAQSVRSAANLCSLCETSIAQNLAALRRGLSLESLPFPVSTSEHREQILRHHLALYVAGREDTDIILTTANLRTLLGSVFHAIASTTHRSEERPSAANEKSKRFWYSSKADSDDRLGSKHPTVKPVDLMQWLVRLVTPKGGTVLDCFAGTGTTGEAAFREGFNAVLIEREPEYQNDIRRRMSLVLGGPQERRRTSIKASGKTVDAGPLFA